MAVCERCGGTGQVLSGDELRQQRQEIGWDQLTAAVAMEVSSSYLSDIERGKRAVTPRLERLWRWVVTIAQREATR